MGYRVPVCCPVKLISTNAALKSNLLRLVKKYDHISFGTAWATDNAAVESFNGRLRQECLNAHWFLSLADAQAKIGAWRQDYNESRPHSALGWATPADFARRCCLQAATAMSEEPEVSTSERY